MARTSSYGIGPNEHGASFSKDSFIAFHDHSFAALKGNNDPLSLLIIVSEYDNNLLVGKGVVLRRVRSRWK